VVRAPHRQTSPARNPPPHRQLEDVIRLYIATSNQTAKQLKWVRTADEILVSVARFCQRASRFRTLIPLSQGCGFDDASLGIDGH
jgi:hypothetical protein